VGTSTQVALPGRCEGEMPRQKANDVRTCFTDGVLLLSTLSLPAQRLFLVKLFLFSAVKTMSQLKTL